MKKLKSLLATLAMLLCTISASAHSFEVDGIYYNITFRKTVQVTYRGSSSNSYSNEYSGDVVIPETVTYESKTYSITSIGEYAFCYCSSLTSVTIPNSVTSIGRSAFYGTAWYNNQPDGLVYAGKVAYKYKGTMPINTSIELAEGTLGIAGGAFENCPSLTSITIPNSVTSIGEYAFWNCSSLTSVTIPNSVTSIGECAFWNCSSLTSVTIPNSVTSIGSSAFSGCSSLTSINIPNGVTSIGSSAFSGCSSLKTMVVGTGVLSIGSGQTRPVKTIWLTNTPPSGYSNLAGNINYVANEQYGSMSNKKVYKYLSSMFEVDGITYVPVNPSERTCDVIDCNYDSTLTDIKINETVSYKNISMNVKEVMPHAFYGNKYIKNISLKNNGGVGIYAFYQCASLQEAIISNNGSIGSEAFASCTALQKATISNKGNIGSEAFYYCTALQNVAISNKGNIGNEAFYYCTALQNAAISNNGNIHGRAFYNCKSLTTATLGDSIKSLGDYAFSGCKLLKEIIIPNAVKTIGDYCFENCSAMNKAIIGGSVETINRYAFTGCSSLPELTIPKSTTSIGNYAFSGCTGLKKFVIEDRETTLKLGSNGSNPLFNGCPLDYVYIGGDISYSTSPFYRNTSLREVVITDKETEISANEFYGCTNLQNFTVGDGVTTFGDWAFSGCSSLKKLSFGSQLKTIGKEAFSDCVAVTEITSKATTPPTCGSMALDDINKWECTLNIPKGCSAAYQDAEQWKEFFFITEGEGGEPVDPDTPEEKVCATPTISYENGKLIFNCETEGAVCKSTITDDDIASFEANEVQLNVTYNISVYATKEGYKDSEVAKATLCWIDVEPKSEGLTNTDIANVKALPVIVQANNGTITVSGADDGTMVEVYGISGTKLGEAKTALNKATIHTDAQTGSVVIVKVGNKAIKIKI